MSQDLWLQDYDATCRLAQEIAENIHERNRQQRTGGNPAKINMTLRASLQKLKQNIPKLKEGLLRASSRHIMQSEADRRQNLVDDLLTREKQLNATFKGEITEPENPRSSLLTGGAGSSGGVAANPWLVNESEETRGLTFGEIKQQQQQIIEAQDAGLDALAAVISRQKIMGQEIGNELEEHNEIIDDLAHLVDKTDDRIRNETRRVKLVENKSASCALEFSGLTSTVPTLKCEGFVKTGPGVSYSLPGGRRVLWSVFQSVTGTCVHLWSLKCPLT
uniref:Syntaxin-8 n=1 Tax=Cynoglossus semilaevis TaxID=244447 RepID=A0A3P8UXX6_CYNSE